MGTEQDGASHVQEQIDIMLRALAAQKTQLESQAERVSQQLSALTFQSRELERLIGRLKTQKSQLEDQGERMRAQVTQIAEQVARIETLRTKLSLCGDSELQRASSDPSETVH